MTQGERLAEFSTLVRGSSLKRFRKVLLEDRGWRPASGRLSFADHLKHLVDCDRWFLAALRGEPEPHADVRPGYGEVDRWEEYVGQLEALGREKEKALRSLTDQDLNRILDRPESVAGTDVGILFLRHNLDHEVHHRGAMNLLLLLRYPS
jgi:uncharacterized damage-inducible protein DinB